MKDYKPTLLQLLNEWVLVRLEMVLLTLIDFRELEIVLLFGVERKFYYFLLPDLLHVGFSM